jgi:hypothetical protein
MAVCFTMFPVHDGRHRPFSMASSLTTYRKLLTVLALLALQHIIGVEGRKIVAARVMATAAARKELPALEAFIAEVVPQFPAVIGVEDDHNEFEPEKNQPTRIQLLDSAKHIVTSIEITPANVENLGAVLELHGLHREVRAPDAFSITPTPHCVAWRETSDCDADGNKRVPEKDETCLAFIANGRSGYCECSNREFQHYGCVHTPFECEEVCREVGDEAHPDDGYVPGAWAKRHDL